MLDISELKFQLGETQILNGITFSVREGEKLGIIGPNGSGKTTLFNCISGFNFPSSGTITFRGKNITRLRPSFRARLGLGRVFQNFGIFRDLTVLENMLIALETSQFPLIFPWSVRHRSNRIRAMELLSAVGLAEKAEQKAGSLSGGQMRILEISRSMAFGADLFLLDEPTAGVSPKMKTEILHALQQLDRSDKTVLIIEHDINFIQQLCDRTIVLDMGRIVLDDTTENVRGDTRLHEIYFGSNGSGSTNGHRQTEPLTA